MDASNARQVSFRVKWIDAHQGVGMRTLAKISLIVDQVPIWPVADAEFGGFEWYADELLSHLAECWKPLLLRQTYPIPIQPERPSYLMAEARGRWQTLSAGLVEIEQEKVASFEDVHNLACAFGGVSGLLPMWFLRDQDQMIIDTHEKWVKVPVASALDALASVGDDISRRLSETDDPKWTRLVKAWTDRQKGSEASLLAWTIGQDKDLSQDLISRGLLVPPASFEEAMNDNDELRIAARLAGPLLLAQMATVLNYVKGCKKSPAKGLDDLAKAARNFLESQGLGSEKPHVQGTRTANWLREALAGDRKIWHENIKVINIFELLKRKYVDVRVVDFAVPKLEAVAVWGPRHGPTVLLNEKGFRVGSLKDDGAIWRHGPIRVTAAHELCHLLLDSGHTLSAVDVLDGRMPLPIEQRARAFAAELLLPSDEAAKVWRDKGASLELESVKRVVSNLCKKYMVTASVAAWQLEHGVPIQNQYEMSRVLNQVAPNR